WTATDGCGNASTCAQTINVYDNEAPAITCPAKIGRASCREKVSLYTGSATATDNCSGATVTYLDGPHSDGNCAGNYSFVRTWTATDGCGNARSEERRVRIEDRARSALFCPKTAIISSTASQLPLNTCPTAASE